MKRKELESNQINQKEMGREEEQGELLIVDPVVMVLSFGPFGPEKLPIHNLATQPHSHTATQSHSRLACGLTDKICASIKRARPSASHSTPLTKYTHPD